MSWYQRIRELARQSFSLEAGTVDALVATGGVLFLALALRRVSNWILDRRVDDLGRRYLLRKTRDYVLGFALLLLLVPIWLGGGAGMGTYLGILSAGLAIALQDPLTNLAGWLFIVIRKPFTVGDRVELGGTAGDVIDLRLFAFSLVEIGNWVDADQSTGRIIHIPNGWVFKHSLANYTQGFSFVWHEIPVVVTFESEWREAKRILGEIAARHAAIQSEQAAEEVRRAARKYLIFYRQLTPIVWTRVVDIGVELTIRYPTEARGRRGSEQAIWEEILGAFAERDDIDFAYPTTRFYDNAAEGKPGARATPPISSGGPASGSRAGS